MNDGFQFLDLIILAMIAGFIALRLRNVLGRRHGDEPRPSAEELKGPGGQPRDGERRHEAGRDQSETVVRLEQDPALRKAFREILRQESWFDIDGFLDGARAVYPIILEAFWNGDRDALRPYLNDDVYQQFSEAIEAREQAGQRIEAKVMDLLEARITAADVKGDTAELTVGFTAEIVSVTRDAEDRIVEGTLSDTIQIKDVWTFERHLGSEDPNWALIATRSE